MSDLVKSLSKKLQDKGWMIATAESCTGGMIAAAMTDLTGSSALFDRGFVTYSNEAKMELLGVSRETLATYGAVSAEVAGEMVTGALLNSHADLAVSVTGIAGPGGGTMDKPVGLVYIATAIKGGEPHVSKNIFAGERADVRRQSVETALRQLEKLAG